MKNNKYLIMKEKRELVLEGKNILVCVGKSKKNAFGNEKGIVKTLKYIPSKKDPKMNI